LLYGMKDFKQSTHVFLSPANSFAENNRALCLLFQLLIIPVAKK
jgi:hypothetical protein